MFAPSAVRTMHFNIHNISSLDATHLNSGHWLDGFRRLGGYIFYTKKMSTNTATKDGNAVKEKALCYDIDDFSDNDHQHFAEFINWDNFDINRMYQVHIMHRDEKFEAAEVLCIMEDEIQIKCRGSIKQKVHNEKIGMDFQCHIEADWDLSLLKKDISGVRVSRRTSCDCERCQERQSQNDYQQPDGYEIDLFVGGRDISVVVYNKEQAFHIKHCIQYWLLRPIKLTRKMKRK